MASSAGQRQNQHITLHTIDQQPIREDTAPLSAGLVWSALLSLVQANIPTYVLLAVYFFCRSGHRRKKQLDRMQVQDL